LAAAETPAARSASSGAKPHHATERRQLTVMFCDLVGSTARFDPEELREENLRLSERRFSRRRAL